MKLLAIGLQLAAAAEIVNPLKTLLPGRFKRSDCSVLDKETAANGDVVIETKHPHTDDERCDHVVTCANKEVAFWRFTKIEIEDNSSCHYDDVQVHWTDRITGNSANTGKICGNKNEASDPEYFEWANSNSKTLTVKWKTDGSVVRWGFKMEVKCVDVTNLDECAEGLHDCHADATCTDKTNGYECACPDQFYTGDGFNCEFTLGAKFLIDTYRHTISISDRYVQSEIALVVENKNTVKAELYEFGVKLDEYEFISGLTMRVGDDGPVTVGDVHREQEAEEIFQQAVSNGQGAALTSQTPNIEKDTTFATKISVPPGGKLYIWLNYDMQLKRTLKNYKYKTNIRPYDPVERMELIVDIDESRPVKEGQTYVWFEGNDKQTDDTFNREILSNGHFVYSFSKNSLDVDEFQKTIRVEYDVNRPTEECGDIILRDGYFVHYIRPDDSRPLPKNVVLTVDTSGSMGSYRMSQAKEAMKLILNDLNEDDTFWLQEFASYTNAPTQETRKATPGNIASGIQWISSLSAGGGTNLNQGALNSVNRPLDANRANIAFIISDGFPTVGISDWASIQASVLSANTRADGAGQKWAVFNFGIGGGAPMEELGKMSVQNMGIARQVFDDGSVKDILSGFFDEYASPVIWNNKFDYAGVTQFDCSSTNLYADQELVCIGQLEDSCSAQTLNRPGYGQLLADNDMFNPRKCKVLDQDNCAEGSNGVPFIPEDQRDLMDNPIGRPKYVQLGKVYAYQNMRKQLDLYAATRNEDLRTVLKEQISDFAVEHDFVTRFTSLVVVQAQVRKRRSREKQMAVQALFQEYNQEVQSLIAMEKARDRRDTSSAMSRSSLFIFSFGMIFIALASPARRFMVRTLRMRL